MTENTHYGGATGAELFQQAEHKEEQGDFRGAFRGYLAAARLGDVMGQLALGNCYAAGRGVRKDLDEAARWYKTVYRNGQSSGALNLAVDLEKQGNTRGATAWLKRAVAMNDGDAHLRLARIYLKKRNAAKAVADLLGKAIQLSPSDISDETREQARKLLRRISKPSSS